VPKAAGSMVSKAPWLVFCSPLTIPRRRRQVQHLFKLD
jgi:hypothetical protein